MLKRTLLILFVLAPSLAMASGFGVFTQGARGLGQANSVVAHPAGPSSLYFNPALLNQVDGRQVEVGTTLVSSSREFTSSVSGGTVSGDDDVNLPSSFYYTEQHGKLAAGIGLYFPFGLSTAWPEDFAGRYISSSADMFSLNINPAVAYQITDTLSLAAGLDLMYLSAELKNHVNQVFVGLGVPAVLGGPINDPTMPDIVQSFDGEGWGHGLNLGLLWKMTDKISAGMTYRSAIEVSVGGSANFVQVDPRLAPFFPATTGNTEITLPAQATFGLAAQINTALTLEAGARWEGWSEFDELRINLDTPILGQAATVTPRNWDDTWAFNVGGEYQLNQNVSLLAGYLFGENPVPDSTFDPSIPDSDAQLITVGTNLTFDAWSVALAYGYEMHEDRSKNNAIGDPLDPTGINPLSFANGEYTADIHLFALSVGYKF